MFLVLILSTILCQRIWQAIIIDMSKYQLLNKTPYFRQFDNNDSS